MVSGEEMWGGALPPQTPPARGAAPPLDPPHYCKPNTPSVVVLPRHDGHDGHEGDEGCEGDEVSALNGAMAGMLGPRPSRHEGHEGDEGREGDEVSRFKGAMAGAGAATFGLVNRAPTP